MTKRTPPLPASSDPFGPARGRVHAQMEAPDGGTWHIVAETEDGRLTSNICIKQNGRLLRWSEWKRHARSVRNALREQNMLACAGLLPAIA